ncbi:MAG: PKD domain-containing protein [Verrucomicrobiota bacterium]
MDPAQRFLPAPARLNCYLILLVLVLTLGLSARAATLSPTNIVTLDFRAADRVWDAVHRAVILCDSAGHRVLSMGVDGKIRAVWQAAANQFPESLSLAPDGRRIAVTLPERPHNDFWFDGQSGGVVVLEVDTLTLERTLPLSLDPWDVALIEGERLLVSGGSGQFTSVHLYEPGASEPAGTQAVRQRSYLMPSRDGHRVYLADSDLGPASLRRLDLNPESAASRLSDSGRSISGFLPARSRPLSRPDDAMVVLNGSDVVGLDTSPGSDLVRVGVLAPQPQVLSAVVWDSQRGMLLTCSDSPETLLLAYNASSLLPVWTATLDRAVDALFVDGDALYGTVRESERTSWVQLPHPGLGAETNAAPVAAFRESSEPSVDAPVLFDAGESRDDGGRAGLAFAWDFDGDGVLEIPFSSEAKTSHQFLEPGPHPVTVVARDYWGATNSLTRIISVASTTNLPPVAAFSWRPVTVETGLPVVFDASASSDDQLPGVPLSVQWDWDGDGAYDTLETTSSQASHVFHVAGRVRVALGVRDVQGATNRVEREIEVVQRVDPGLALLGQPAFDLAFTASAMWVDSVGGYAYFTDPEGRRLVRMRLPSGIPDREWRFEFPTDALASSPDGKTLYISELVIPRSSFNFGRQEGLIGILDVPTGNLLRKFSTDVDPGQLLATAGGPLLVGGGSAQLTQLKSYDPSNGRVLGRGDVRENSAILARGAERALVLTTFGSSATVAQFRIGPDGTLSEEQGSGSVFLESVWAPWAISPGGKSIISANGYRLSVPSDPALPVALEGRLSVDPTDDQGGAVAFDREERKAAFRGTRNRLDWFETTTWSRIRSFPTVPSVRFLGLWSDWLVVAGNGGHGTQVELLPNPVAGAETNQAPVVVLTTKGGPFSTASAVEFDVSGTTDDLDSGGSLEFRWDWTDDGNFDTEFSPVRTAQHRYFLPGTWTARVQVRDRFGFIASGSAAFSVAAVPDPGFAGRTNNPFQLDFPASGVAFDGPRHRAFVSDTQAREVVAVDLDTGLEIRRWTVPGLPERMSTTPDSRRLYVALPAAPHRYESTVPNGDVVEFDLEAMAMTRLIPVETDPWELAATDDGILVVSSGSNQFGPVDAYRLSDGVRTARMVTRFRLRTLLDPDQNSVWVLTTDSSPQVSTRLDLIRSSSSFVKGYEAFGEPNGPSVAIPLGGGRVLDRRGRILSGANLAQVLVSPANAPTMDGGLVQAGGQWIVAPIAEGVRYWASGDPAWLPWTGNPAGAAFVGPVGNRHGLAVVGTTTTEFSLRSLPARDASSNQPPEVSWSAAIPEGIAVPGTVELRAKIEDEDGEVVSAELWSGNTKLADLSPKNPYFVASIGAVGTNQFRIVVHDNLGAATSSPERRVVGRNPPSVVWVEPSFPAVDPGTPFVMEVTATPGDGSISRVVFTAFDSAGGSQTRTVTSPPWRASLPGIRGDTRLSAVAYDELGVASRDVIRDVHAIGEEGDDFYRPFILGGGKLFDLRSTALATRQPGEPVDPLNSFAGRSLWWRWTAPSNGMVAISTAGSTLDTYLAVFSGTGLGALRTEGSNQDAPGASPFSLVKLKVTQATTYFIFVDSPFSIAGEVALSVAYESVFAPSPPNDLFANRTLIRSVPARFEVETLGATVENLEPVVGGRPGGHSVWWEWVAPAAGRIEVTTKGSSFDTLLGVYSPSNPGFLSPLSVLGANDDTTPEERTSRVQARVKSGQTVYAVVDGFAGASGLAVLSLAFTPEPEVLPPPNDAFSNALWIVGESVLESGTLLGSTRETDEQLPLAQTSVWWRWTAPRSALALITVESSPSTGLGIAPIPTVWIGSAVSNVVPVASVAGSRVPGRMAFEAVGGQTYHLRFAGSLKSDFNFSLNAFQPPLSDRLIRITRVTGGPPILNYVGPVPTQGTLQKSRNLKDWTDVATRTWQSEDDYSLPDVTEDEVYLRILIRP